MKYLVSDLHICKLMEVKINPGRAVWFSGSVPSYDKISSDLYSILFPIALKSFCFVLLLYVELTAEGLIWTY